MGNGDNHDLLVGFGIYDAEREAAKNRPSESSNGRADSRALQYCLNCALHVIEKRPLVLGPMPRKRWRPRSALPLPREDSDGESLQALARFGHYLITGNRFNLASKVLRVSTLSLLKPKFLDLRIMSRVQLIDELADERSLLSRWEGSDALREIVELAAHASIIDAAFNDR